MWHDEETHRPVLAITSAFGSRPLTRIALALSPTMGVPTRVLEDVLGTLSRVATDAVILKFGLQEDFELRLSPDNPQGEGELSTGP